MEKNQEKKKLTLKERWKDKRERAKLELMLYGIFFLVIIVLAQFSSSMSNNGASNNNFNNSFIDELNDNYQYEINIVLDNNNYKYYGKKLGNNMTIIRNNGSKEDYFYQKNDKLYILDTKGNYILTTTDEVYPYIEYRYLDINNIKQFIKLGTNNNGLYSINVSDIVLNNNTDDVITIKVDELSKTLVVDYTNLFKIDNNDLIKEEVTISFLNINNINSLDE